MLKRTGSWHGDERGIAAVEFAFIAPALLVIFFATIELGAALNCRAKVNQAVSTAADLTAQASTVSASDMSNVVSAVGAILYPNASGSAHIVISSIVDNDTGNGKVAWSYASNATARTTDSTVTLPSGLITAGSGQSVILAEITYDYSSPTTQFVTGTINMSGVFYARPRRTTTVSCSDC